MSRDVLRIAIDGRPALWPRTGIGTIVRNVLRKIVRFDESNQYFAYFDNDPGAIDAWIPVECRWGGSRQKLIWANTWLSRQLRFDGIDVFVTFLDKELPFLPTRARVVSMVHDLIPLTFPKVVFRNPAHRLYYNTLIRASIRRSNLILTNSEFSKREIISKLGAQAAKVQRITLGVDAPEPVSESRTALLLRRCELARPYVLALGSTEPRKNNRRVIEAFRAVRASHPSLQLAIAGSNWRGLTFPPGFIDGHVRELGHVPDGDLSVLMQSAEMLVFPSLHEGFGLPVIEAMALGIPVITSNTSALPEVAGDAALFADPNSTDDIAENMKLILENLSLAEDLRRRGRERARKFKWETTCAELVSACTSLTEKKDWRGQPVTL
jgi:alpha-1,3-rhamnosyl/mannosyltransferase